MYKFPSTNLFKFAYLSLIWMSATAMAQENAESGGASVAAVEQTSFAKAFFVSQGSMLGTAIIWFLLLLSISSFGLMGYMWLNNRRINILPEGVVKQAKRLIQERQYRDLLNLVSQEESYFSEVLSSSLREASHGYGAMVRAMEQAGDEFSTRRLRRIELLNVIGNVAPMIGLFGTVYGMILTFQGIVASGGRPNPVDLAGGIGTALTTTFWGLVVAIPSLAGYAVIRNNIDTLTSEASLAAGEIVNQFRPIPGAAPPPSSAPTRAATPASRRPQPAPVPQPVKSATSISSKTPLASAVESTKRTSRGGK